MFTLIKSSTQVFMTRTNCKQRLPDTYVIKDYANVVKFLTITSNSTQDRQNPLQKAQNVKKLVFQKNRKKMYLYKPV